MVDALRFKPSHSGSCSKKSTKCCLSWQHFNTGFVELLEPGNPSAVILGAFIRRNLSGFHLSGLYCEKEVLHEVFIRAHRFIHAEGIEIQNPSAWVRKTALNMIREWNRNGHRVDSLDREVIDERAKVQQTRLSIESDVPLIERTWQSLTAEEQRLLTLKVFDKFSWQEIAAIYASEGKTIPESTLRQQKTQALIHLRRIYHGLRPLTDLHTLPIKRISRWLQLNVGWACDGITHTSVWLRALTQGPQVQSLIAPTTFQPQGFIHPQSTDDFQLARSLATVASSFRQFIAKSGSSPNVDQAFCYQLVYHI
jgi:DNA-directed RNA polymerase specialized sigma24 family protein